ncbi:hypothetical protein VUR80DRAFT_9373 [Thermomyces stellatus]
MSQALRSPVPSNALLCFLRAQSQDLPSIYQRCRPLHAPRRVVPQARRASALAKRQRRTQQSIATPPNDTLAREWHPLRRRSAPSPRTGSAAFTTTTRCANGSNNSQRDQGERQLTWQEKLWGMAARRGSKPLKPDDLPGRDDDMYSPRRTMSAKAALEPRVRCTEVDENGETTITDGEFKKTELIAKYGLLPRDLRKIDSSNLPHILVRPSAILINLLHLKVLIKHDRVLLFDVFGTKTSYPQSAFMYDLQGKLRQKNTAGNGGLPYEFRALEAVLTSVTSELEADFEAVQDPVMRVLSELEDDIDREKLRVLLILSKRVSTFEQKAKLVRDAIDELLEADDDLADMYLTEKARDIYRGIEDHTEVEILLESYHKICDEIAQEASNLVSSIRNTEEIIRAILDANRNALMLLDLKFSIGTLGLAMGTFLAGLYGMNLENFIEETNWGFAGVTGMSVAFSLLVCWYGLVKLRKVQRVKMLGDERATLPRPHHQAWLSQASGLDARGREKVRRMNMQKVSKPKRWFW